MLAYTNTYIGKCLTVRNHSEMPACTKLCIEKCPPGKIEIMRIMITVIIIDNKKNAVWIKFSQGPTVGSSPPLK